MPALILISFTDMDGRGIFEPDAIAVSVFSAAYTLLIFVGARVVLRGYKGEGRKEILVMNMVMGNVTFVGLPFISFFFGVWGVRLAILFSVVQDFFIWSLCYYMFSQKGGLKQTLKTVLNPCFVAIALGFVLAGLERPLPAFAVAPLGMLAVMTVPLALLCIGSMLAQNTGLLRLIDRDVVLSLSLKAFVLPVAVFAVLSVIGVDLRFLWLCTILTALPTALLSVMFAKEFEKDADFAKVVFVLSTLLFILIGTAIHFVRMQGVLLW